MDCILYSDGSKICLGCDACQDTGDEFENVECLCIGEHIVCIDCGVCENKEARL